MLSLGNLGVFYTKFWMPRIWDTDVFDAPYLGHPI
jgi:hypothetical protein